MRVFQGLPALLAPLQVHDVALPGDEEPRARRAAGARSPAARPPSRSTTSAARGARPAGRGGETIDAVWRALARSNPDLKMALLLRDVVGLPYNEIADSLEITLATVKWRIFKAREEVPARARARGHHLRESARSRRAVVRLAHLSQTDPQPHCQRHGQAGRPRIRLGTLDRVGRPVERPRSAPRSSSSHPARASPSRGWPTDPGLRSAAARRAVARVPGGARPPASRPSSSRPRALPGCGRPGRRARPSRRLARRSRPRARSPTSGRGGSRGTAPSPGARRSGSTNGANRCDRRAERTFCVQRAATAASPLKSETSSPPTTARSWLPQRHTELRSRTRAQHSLGCGP